MAKFNVNVLLPAPADIANATMKTPTISFISNTCFRYKGSFPRGSEFIPWKFVVLTNFRCLADAIMFALLILPGFIVPFLYRNILSRRKTMAVKFTIEQIVIDHNKE